MSTRLRLPHPHRRTNRTRKAARRVEAAPAMREVEALAPDAHRLHPNGEARLPPEPDVDACKVREAGGPLDMAAYVCLCGFAFAAAVSTSVECPHCGAKQAW
jgi:hypothetical protein